MKLIRLSLMLLGLAMLSACGQPTNPPDEGVPPGADALMADATQLGTDTGVLPGPDTMNPSPDVLVGNDAQMMGGACVAYANPSNPLCTGAASCSCPMLRYDETPNFCRTPDMEMACVDAMSCQPGVGARCSPHLPLDVMAGPCEVENELRNGIWVNGMDRTSTRNVMTVNGTIWYGWNSTYTGAMYGDGACVGRFGYMYVGLAQRMGTIGFSVWEFRRDGTATVRNYAPGANYRTATPTSTRELALVGMR